MKKLLAFLLLAVAAPAWGQVKTANFMHAYDVDGSAGVLNYCVVAGQRGDPFGPPLPGVKVGTSALAFVQTSGTNANVTAVTAADEPFTDLAVGDTVLVTDNLTNVNRAAIIITRTNAHDITLDQTVTLTKTGGHTFQWRDQTCGTGLANGWINVVGASEIALSVQYDQGDLDSLVVRWECKHAGLNAQPVILYPQDGSTCFWGTLATQTCEFPVAGLGIVSRATVVDPAPMWSHCRLGVAFKTTDTSDATTNLERVTGILTKK